MTGHADQQPRHGWHGSVIKQAVSAPAFHMLENLDGQGQTSPQGDGWIQEGLSKNDWFTEHMEWSNPRWIQVGSPRPSARTVAETKWRKSLHEERLRKLSWMERRYRAEMEIDNRSMRKIRSLPDLLHQVEAYAEQEARTLSVESSSMSCSNPCAVFQRIAALVGIRRGRAIVPTFDSPENAVIIFDWDDTLLPTTFIINTVLPSLPPDARAGMLPKGTWFWEILEAHARVVNFVLRAARRLARVAIVTNSLSPWVLASGQNYLPGLDIEGLLLELEIPVYYARRHIPSIRVDVSETQMTIDIDRTMGGLIGLDVIPLEGSLMIARIEDSGLVAHWNREHEDQQVQHGDRIVEVNGKKENLTESFRRRETFKITLVREVPNRDPFREAKRIDMKTCLETFYSGKAGAWRQNAISVGDSVHEQNALKEVLDFAQTDPQNIALRSRNPPLCKTVHLLESPSAEQLSMELRILMVWLDRMVRCDKNFDCELSSLDGLEKDMLQARCSAK